jgi:hypothetical protein
VSEQQLAALQEVLASEHATIWAYGEIGARVSDAYLQAVTDADNRHRAMRGTIEDSIRGLGGDPVPSESAYSLPTLLTDDSSALALAASLEESMAQQWRYCIGAEGPADAPFRQLCLDGLDSSARAALAWRSELDPAALPPAFPGMA